MKLFTLMLTVMLLVLGGCGTQEISVAKLGSICNSDTTDHCAYLGTENGYHLIRHSQLFGGGKYRISTDKLRLKKTFPLNQGKPYVVTRGMIDKGRTRE